MAQKHTRARVYQNTSWSFLSHEFFERLWAGRGVEWNQNKKCVLCLHNNRSLDVFRGEIWTQTRTHTEYSRWLSANWHSNRANTERELSICAHRLDWFEKVALKVTSKRQDQNRRFDTKKKEVKTNRSSRAFHASEMLVCFDFLIDLCGGAADKFGGVLLIISFCC
jgi:hypothetical protein